MNNNLDLFPSGEFIIKIGEQTIKGKMGTWSTKRLCDKYGVKTYGEAITHLSKYVIDDVATFILIPVEYFYRNTKEASPYSIDDAYEWIDAIGGMYSENMNRLITHASVTVGLPPEATTIITPNDDKKKLQNGTIYSEPATLPE